MREVGLQTEVGEIVSEDLAYDNKFFPVISRVVKTPAGIVREPQFLLDRGGKFFAIAVACDEYDNYILVDEPKYGQMKRVLSVPTGGVKKGETPLTAAKREFLNETGYISDHWEESGLAPLIDFADKIDGGEHHIFYARNARRHQDPRDPERKVFITSKHSLMEVLRVGIMCIPAMSLAALLLPR